MKSVSWQDKIMYKVKFGDQELRKKQEKAEEDALYRANGTGDRDKKPQELRSRNRVFLILRGDDLSFLCFIGFSLCCVLSINPLFMQGLSLCSLNPNNLWKPKNPFSLNLPV